MKQLLLVFLIINLLLVPGITATGQPADAGYQTLPFSAAWNNINLITTNDDWSGVPGVMGFRGDNLTSSTGVDPQTVLADDTPGVVDVIANQTDPGLTTGGVAEYELANPAVALNGSGTADAPYLLIHLNTTGFQDIQVQYNLRDLDDTADNAVQQVALHYRVGATGNFTNVAAAFVADATTGGAATQVTPVNVVLPAAADNQPQVQLRIMTTNAPGNDEWVGVDDIHVMGTPAWVAPVINEFSASTTGIDVEYVEVLGAASTDLATCQILDLEGDNTSNEGTVDEVIAVGTTDAAGFWLANLAADSLENGTVTLLLVKNFSGALGDDLDANDDGVLDTTPWEVMFDAVAVNDGGAGDLTYGTPALGPNYDGLSSFAPGGASRIPDGTDTDAAVDWVRNDFDLAGIPGYTGTPDPGEAYNTPGAPNQAVPNTDTPPAVVSTAPTDGATGAPVTENISLTFSEPVDVTAEGVGIACPAGAPVTFSGLPAGDATAVILNPTANLPYDTTCVVTVHAAGVTDNDGAPDVLATDYVFSFTTAPQSLTCAAADTPIGLIQGTGAAFDPAYGGMQTIQGVVVGDYEGASPALRGFYVQNLDTEDDDNPASSDAIFIFEYDNADRVGVGQIVQVTGTVADYQGQTQISSATVEICEVAAPPALPVTQLTLPFASADDPERFEGMLVTLPQTLYVTEHFQLGRFNQVVLSSGARLQQPTAVIDPGAPALAFQAANDLNRIIVDDALNSQNPDPIAFGRDGQPLSASNTLRGGDTVTGWQGVLTYTWSGNSASGNAYRLRPVNAEADKAPNFQPANARPAAPAPVGTLQVAGLNLLNFFNTFGAGCTNGVGGAVTDCRGADSQTEFDRQWPKTVAAIVKTGADVIACSELENDGYGADSAIQTLVTQLNAATAPGTYAFIDADAGTGQVNALGTDAIKVGLIYQPARVTPVGATAALNSAAFVNGGDSTARNRPALAQAFAQTNGERFIVLANHFKSKGSACDAPDAGDGQGNCNVVRTNAAAALRDWLATDPTGTGDPDVLILGDLNSYAREDPIRALEAGGYTNLVRQYGGEAAYSYVFDGQWGYLDHALASASLAGQVKGAGEYHINADEPSVLDYNTDYKTAGQQVSLYAADEFRAADHDPLIVSLALGIKQVYLPLINR